MVPLEPLTPSVGERPAIEQTVHDWATAWSQGRVADYLRFYGQAFRPANGKGRERWQVERRARLSGSSNIRVTLDELQVRLAGSRRAWVEFIQTYRSDSYQDKVRKLLEMRLEDDAWKIVEEQVIAELAAP